MLGRLLTALITLFWLIMTVLLVRVAYYPEGSRFAMLPPEAVLRMFLERGASGKQLHLYRGESKVGHLAFDLRRASGSPGSSSYTLLFSGMMERGALRDDSASMNWRLNLGLQDARNWTGASGQLRWPSLGEVLDFNWRQGSPTPEFTFRRRGGVEVDDRLLQPLLGQIRAGGALGGSEAGAMDGDFLKISAREGVTRIAGQRRKGYMVEFSVMGRYRATAVFTEEGDLALIEFPEGYRALEPYIHGLVPDDLD